MASSGWGKGTCGRYGDEGKTDNQKNHLRDNLETIDRMLNMLNGSSSRPTAPIPEPSSVPKMAMPEVTDFVDTPKSSSQLAATSIVSEPENKMNVELQKFQHVNAMLESERQVKKIGITMLNSKLSGSGAEKKNLPLKMSNNDPLMESGDMEIRVLLKNMYLSVISLFLEYFESQSYVPGKEEADPIIQLHLLMTKIEEDHMETTPYLLHDMVQSEIDRMKARLRRSANTTNATMDVASQSGSTNHVKVKVLSSPLVLSSPSAEICEPSIPEIIGVATANVLTPEVATTSKKSLASTTLCNRAKPDASIRNDSKSLNKKLKPHVVDKALAHRGFFCTCGQQYLTNQKLRLHIAYYSNEKTFHCPTGCGNMFPYLSYLKYHMKTKHKIILPISCVGCRPCGMIFDSNQKLVEHQIFVHSYKHWNKTLMPKRIKSPSESIVSNENVSPRPHTLDGNEGETSMTTESQTNFAVMERKITHQSTTCDKDMHVLDQTKLQFGETCCTCGRKFKNLAGVFRHISCCIRQNMSSKHEKSGSHNTRLCTSKNFKRRRGYHNTGKRSMGGSRRGSKLQSIQTRLAMTSTTGKVDQFDGNQNEGTIHSNQYQTRAKAIRRRYKGRKENIGLSRQHHNATKIECTKGSVPVTGDFTKRLKEKHGPVDIFEFQRGTINFSTFGSIDSSSDTILHSCKCGERFSSEQQLLLHTRSESQANFFKCKFCSRRFLWRSTLKKHLVYHQQASVDKKKCRSEDVKC